MRGGPSSPPSARGAVSALTSASRHLGAPDDQALASPSPTFLAGAPAIVMPGCSNDLFTTAFAPIAISSAIRIGPKSIAPGPM